MPGQPDRPVALRRREVPELLTEELRRLDPDDVYASTVKRLTRMSAGRKGGAATKTAATKKAAKKTGRRRPRRRPPTA